MQDPPRALELEGASNVRDLGGWPTQDGGRVRFGRIFRAAALTGLTESDLATIAGTGVRCVCDLRGRREAAGTPSEIARVPGVVLRHLPIEPSVGASLRDILSTGEATGEDVLAVMRRAYVAYALEWSHRYRELLGEILDRDALPLMFHCSAGKDRTGFGAALILSALGVPYPSVKRDYLASNRLWRGDAAIAAGLPAHVAETLLQVHGELLDAAFAAITEAFGTFERYASVELSLDSTRLARLRGLLLEE